MACWPSLRANLSTQLFVEGDFNGSGEFFGRPDLVGILLPDTHAGHFLNSRPFKSMHAGRWRHCIAGTQHLAILGSQMLWWTSLSKFDCPAYCKQLTAQ